MHCRVDASIAGGNRCQEAIAAVMTEASGTVRTQLLRRMTVYLPSVKTPTGHGVDRQKDAVAPAAAGESRAIRF